MRTPLFVLMMIFMFAWACCQDSSRSENQPIGEKAAASGKNAKQDNDKLAGKGRGGNGDDKPAAIPNAWKMSDSLENFPTIDFTKVKSINEAAESPEEKKREEQARKLYNQFCQDMQNGKDVNAMLEKLEKDYHSTQAAIDAAFRYAEYQQTKLGKEEAVKVYEWILNHWPESWRRWDAIWRINELLGIYVYLYNYSSWHSLDSQNIHFQVNGRGLSEAKISIYRVDLFRMIEEGINPQTPAIPDHAEQVTSWTQKFKESGWFNHNISMPKLSPGYYILSLGTKYMTLNALFSTSRVALMTKSDGKMLLCWAKDQLSKESIGTCKVMVLKDGNVIYKGTSNEDGLFAARIKIRENDSSNFAVLYKSRHGDAASGSYYWWYSGYYQRIGYTFTDRPVYRPGQKVYYKGIFRTIQGEKEEMAVKREHPIQLTIYDQNWRQISQTSLTINEFGSVKGEYAISETAALGTYYLYFSGGDGYYSQATFEVQEYKKPEYEVVVRPEKGSVLQGETCDIVANARYYFGEPVKEAEVEYQIYEAAYWYYHYWGWEYDWSWFEEEQDERYHHRHWYGGSEQLIDQGKTKISADGTMKIQVKTRTNTNNDLKYNVRVSVTDKSRRSISGFGSFLATRAAFKLSITTERYCYRPGERVSVKIFASDYANKGISVPVVLSVSRQGTSGYTAMYSEKLKTDSSGWARHEFVPDENGYYQFQAVATDSRNRDIQAGHYCWVADHSWRSPITYSGVNLELEKSVYTPGDRARMIFTTGYASSWALLTLENQRIHAYRLINLKGSAFAGEEEIGENCQPYVFAKVSMMENGSLVETQKKITVPPVQKFLKVAVARDKAQYTPGSKATYTIKVSDWQDRPVRSEFSFGLVDEAIYAIRADQTPDIRKSFHLRYMGNVNSNTSFQFYAEGYGDKRKSGALRDALAGETNSKKDSSADKPTSAAPEKEHMARSEMQSMPEGKENGKKLVEARVRSEFADSGVWHPTIATDERGMAQVSFTMPDNLTTWRATLRVISVDGKTGETIDKVITRQNLMARLECPRTFTERDRVAISGVVHNYLSAEKDCVTRLEVQGAKLLTKSEQNISLKPGEDRRVEWQIEVNTLKEVTLTLYALTDEESDAMKQSFKIVPHGAKIRNSRSGMTDDVTTLSLTLPSTTMPERSELVIRVKPTLAGSMLESLEYLAGYPYGCVEQTMSRFLPSVIVAQTLQAIQITNPKLQEELPKYVSTGTERLYNFQHSDGGWGWWQYDATNPFMTAYVLYGLSIAKGADYEIKQDVIDRGMACLKTLIERETNTETRTYMVFAYSQLTQPSKQWLDQIFAKVDDMNDYSRAIFLLALKKAKDNRSSEILKMLEKNVKTSGDTCYYTGKAWRYSWTDNDVESTAYALKAIVSMNSRHPLIPKLLKWLEIHKQGDHYASTKDTAAVVFAFADYLTHSGELNPDYTGTIEVNGKRETFAFKGPKANGEMKEFRIVPQAGESKITISKQGKGRAYYSAYLDYYSTQEPIKAAESGMTIQREYFRLIPEKQSDGTIKHIRIPLQDKIGEGEVFEVELTLSGVRDFQYVMLEDFKPAGCEFEKETDESKRPTYYYYGWSNKEERDDRLVVFFGYYDRGTKKIIYKLRAETPGEFHAMPAKASMMYFPEISGNSEEKRLTIVPKPE